MTKEAFRTLHLSWELLRQGRTTNTYLRRDFLGFSPLRFVVCRPLPVLLYEFILGLICENVQVKVKYCLK